MSCPDGTASGDKRHVILRARWSFRDGTTYVSQIYGGFDLKTGVAVPFVTVTLDASDRPRGQVRLWTSALLQSNHVSGLHTTGWVSAGMAGRRLAVKLADPHLALQVWAESTTTGLFYCVAATGLTLGTR
jgi:hypothetical protein